MASTKRKAKKSHVGANGAAPGNISHRKDRTTVPVWAVILDARVNISVEEFLKWGDYLTKRKQPVSPRKLFSNIATVPLIWGLPGDVAANADVLELLQRTSKLKRKPSRGDAWLIERLKQWLADRDSRPVGQVDALECLAWAYAAPRLASRTQVDDWRCLMSHLLKTVRDADVGLQHTCGLSHALVAGELPLILAYQFPELPECKMLAKSATKAVTECLEQWLDGSGLPHANHLVSIRPLLATFTRSIRLIQGLAGAKISLLAANEFCWLVQHTLRLTRCDLSSVMSPVESAPARKAFADLLQSAITMTKDEKDAALFRLVRHTNAPKTHKAPRDSELPDEPSYQSDWSECAVLQPTWSPNEPRLTITYADRQLRCEFTIGNEMVLAGDMMPSIAINGASATIAEDWECVCWYADGDVDMFELRTDLIGGWKLERQIVMAREDQFLMIADSLSGQEKAKLDYVLSLPLCEGIRFAPNDDSREGFLMGKRHLGLVLPLALPEWRTDPRVGTLVASDDQLELHQSVESASLHAPLFIDLHRRRMRTTPTWRQLTVAEELRIVDRDEAVGYRVHVGIEQWLIYRSLRPTISRTVLGQHLSCEFLCGRLVSDGTIEPLVEIAPDDPRANE